MSVTVSGSNPLIGKQTHDVVQNKILCALFAVRPLSRYSTLSAKLIGGNASNRSCSFCSRPANTFLSASSNPALLSSCRCNSAASACKALPSPLRRRRGSESTTACAEPRPIQHSEAFGANSYVTPEAAASRPKQGTLLAGTGQLTAGNNKALS